MKDKTTLVQGIIMCAQGILFDAFSLYAAIPLLMSLWFDDLYSREEKMTIFSLAIWIGVSIGAAIVVNMGKKKIFAYFSDGNQNVNMNVNPNFENSMYGSSVVNEPKPMTVNPSKGEWQCPRCGKINSAYVSTCGCGQVKE